MNVSTGTDEYGNPTVTARNEVAEGRIHLLTDGTLALDGDFGSRMATAQIELLIAALDAVRAVAAVRQIPTDATYTARISTENSFLPDEGPGQLADVVITVDGWGSTPIAMFPLSTNPFDCFFGGDPMDVLAERGWRAGGEGKTDDDEYLIVPVTRM